MSCPYLMKKEQDLFTFLLYRELPLSDRKQLLSYFITDEFFS